MKVTAEIINSEFIGTKCKVTESRHLDYVGIKGEVIGESKNTFTILQSDEPKNVVKETTVFQFGYSDGTVVEIDGKLLVGRPEDRLKKSVKRLW